MIRVKWSTSKLLGGLVVGALLLLDMQGTCRTNTMDQLRSEFMSPPHECTQVPFWFWNDDITEEGIRNQLEWMERNGIHGFVPHARIGLSKKVGYMTTRWLELVRFAVQEATRKGMMVYLYDEGMYPSGSAHGKVVEGRPDLASQGLRKIQSDYTGPTTIEQSWPLSAGEKPVAAVLVKKMGPDMYDPSSAKPIPVNHTLSVHVPEGEWTLFQCIQTPSGGVIRGVHWDEEDNQPFAPPAADLLNPEVTERFIQETHEKYYAALKDYFGTTIRGMFTDEPSFLAKRSKRGLKPWTTGFLQTMNSTLGYDCTPDLPFLWVKSKDGFESRFRLDYQYALDETLNKNYYAPLSRWCSDHNIALTGHPDGAGDVSPQVYFHQPGQDVVWRWVLPGTTSLEGEQSTLGKSASSVAAQLNRPIVINECFGAYGWRLTMDEMKWLADWLFVRGTNRLFPHAFYYSVRDKRIYERPPDLGWNQLWADHYALFSQYTNRLSWLVMNAKPIVHVALLTIAGHTPWRSPKVLFQNQVDFHYLDETLLHRVECKDGTLLIGNAQYFVLVLDGIEYVTTETAEHLKRFLDSGIPIVGYKSSLALHPLRGGKHPHLITEIKKSPLYKPVTDENPLLKSLNTILPKEITISPPCPDLRILHLVKSGYDFYLLTHEGENPLETTLTFLKQQDLPELWNAETGAIQSDIRTARTNEGIAINLHLYPRESKIYAFFPHPDGKVSPQPIVETIDIPSEDWLLEIHGNTFPHQRLGDWTSLDSLQSFSGTGWYSKTFSMSDNLLKKGATITLDAGQVHAWAKVEVNGKPCGVRLWRPFHFDITRAIQPGNNELRIGVTNTRANELTRDKLPSGLWGPVKIRISS